MPKQPGRSGKRALATAVDAVQDLLWPARCVGCDEPGTLLCASCRQRLPWVDQRWACPGCGAPFGWLTCTECARDWESASCVSAFVYQGPAAKLVTGYKDGHEGRLAPVLAAALATALDEAAGWSDVTGLAPRLDLSELDAVAFVPSTEAAYRRRGFDHMERVAAELGALVGLPVADVLYHNPTKDQRLFGREERALNVAGSFEVATDVAGSRLLLIDDVVTTGATLREAVRTLLSRGVCEVRAASVARTW